MKNTPEAPKIESGLTHLTRMNKYSPLIWVKAADERLINVFSRILSD